MIFKSSTVALVVSSVLAFNANASDVEIAINKLSTEHSTINQVSNNKDVNNAFNVKDEINGVYLLRLSEKSALDAKYSSLGNDRSSVVAVIEKQQNTILNIIRSLDASAVLTKKARLTENALYVQMTHAAAEQIKSNVNVVSAEILNEQPSYTEADEFSRFPFLTIKDPGDAVTVAIIGNGIDYTHKSLGGKGTVEAYEKAWANRSNAWDGFPTDTVIGGLDFSANGEGYHTIDYNPIEATDDVNVESGALASGTAVAAQVLAEAPDAKILFYKTYDWSNAYFYPVLDVIVDPNQDGDISDRPDVIVMNSYGNSAFYVENDGAGSGATRDIGLVRRLSATGSLLVVGAGKTYYNSYFNLAWRAAVPEALTVGSVSVANDGITLSEFTPAGPNRGEHALKPEVVGPGENFVGAVVGTGDEEAIVIPHTSYAAAYAAGTAARILAQYPQLSPIEAKALVANTASSEGIVGSTTYSEVVEREITNVAEVPFLGSGLVDGKTAITAKSVVWETSSYQPGLAFGFVEATTNTSVSRDVTIKNLTDEVQTYKVSSVIEGNKANNAAINFIYPEIINIPANRSVVFTVTMNVDAEKISELPLVSTEDFTIDNWIKTSLSGYLVFNNTDETSAQLKMPWQVLPKNKASLTKSNPHTSTRLPYDAPLFMEKVSNSGGWVESEIVDVTNDTNVTKLLYTMPLMHSNSVPAPSKAIGQGNLYKNMGASITPEAMCESGYKLSIAVQMFDKFDVPMAEHFDKAGHVFSYMTIYNETVSDKYNDDPFGLDQNATEMEKIGYLEIILDDTGKPQTKYLDFNLEYEWWNPSKRVKYSKLGADVSVGDDTAVAKICIDDLYHDDYQSVDDFNQNLGWIFASDRDAQASIQGPMIRYNPVLNGNYWEEIIDHTGQDGYPNWWDSNCQPKSWNPDNCIEKAVNFLAFTSGVALLPEDDEAELNWGSSVELAPGASARVSSGASLQCNPNVVSAGNWTTHNDCPPGVMIFEIGNENTDFSGATHSVDASVSTGQAFFVYENAENGSVIGQLDFRSQSFFISSDRLGEVFLVNALPGTPFSVSTDGVITVNNAAVLNYEETKSYTLKIHVDYENRDTPVIDVVVNVNNQNDVAPVVVNSLPKVQGIQGDTVNLAINSSFSDTEGDGITFSSNNLPQGLTISRAGVIAGTLDQVGEYQATVTANDGVNTVSASVSFDVAANPASDKNSETTAPVVAPVASPVSDSPEADDSSSTGGSTNLFFIILASFALFSRNARK
ncbi:S8 family serine peptidase [Thalassomonas sp. M1454]|uniref:S8 family serine peptidase n=1 Tax=Thalassomonas sp. M1454 TaxID=2594477 RepID=UPI0011808421|nr:S8 family serine peptidase [Thalassomonas sp. M1454]TRX56948.1 S8 family serine peptidase [Thalassomonas sp. M1454]